MVLPNRVEEEMGEDVLLLLTLWAMEVKYSCVVLDMAPAPLPLLGWWLALTKPAAAAAAAAPLIPPSIARPPGLAPPV